MKSQNNGFKSHQRYIYFLLCCYFDYLHRGTMDLTAGDFSSDVSGTGNALGVCLFVYSFVPCIDNSETFSSQ